MSTQLTHQSSNRAVQPGTHSSPDASIDSNNFPRQTLREHKDRTTVRGTRTSGTCREVCERLLASCFIARKLLQLAIDQTLPALYVGSFVASNIDRRRFFIEAAVSRSLASSSSICLRLTVLMPHKHIPSTHACRFPRCTIKRSRVLKSFLHHLHTSPNASCRASLRHPCALHWCARSPFMPRHSLPQVEHCRRSMASAAKRDTRNAVIERVDATAACLFRLLH